MSKNNLFKSMFALLFAFAAVAFVGCEDDIKDVQAPELTIAPAILNFDELGGTQTVELAANCNWEVSFDETAKDWLDIQPLSGSGNATLSVTTYEKSDTKNEKVTVYFTLYHPEYGKWGKAKSTLTVNQTYGGEPIVEDIFYFNNFDAQAAEKTYGSGSSWPYLDQFTEGWQGHEGTGVENVTYSFKGMSLRNNSNSNGSYSDYAGSGVNNLFFGSSAYFTIEKIAITSTNVNLSFGGEKYLNGSDNLFMPEEFTITLSADGENWSAPIEYTQPEGAGRWNLGGADFTLPEGTETLWIKFAASVASAYRIDDVKLMGGVGGQQITFDGQTENPGGSTDEGEIPEGAVKVTVQEFLDAAEDDTIYVLTGEITGTYNTLYGNFYLKDSTAEVQIYGLLSPSGESQVQYEAAGLKDGDTITVYGARTSYNDNPQMKNATYVSHTSGQGGGGDDPVTPPTGDAIYFNNFDAQAAEKTYGAKGESWPYLDQFEAGWQGHTGSGVAGVTYDYSGMSLRNNSNSNGSYSDYAGSGVNNLFFGKSAYITIENIALETNKLNLTFGGEKYLQGSDNTFSTSEFTITLSADGTNWSSPITYTAPAGSGRWNLGGADFTLPEGTKALYIKFAASVASAYRIDDVTLTAGEGGQEITFEGGSVNPDPTPGEVKKGTIAEFLAAADTATTYELTGEITRVANEVYGNFDLTDETGTVYVYGLLTPDGEAQKQWAAAGLKQGDKITLQGVYSIYNDAPQIKNAIYVSHEAGQGGGGDDPVTPPVAGEGEYVSDSNFVSDGDQYANPCGLGDVTINGSAVTGFKLGTGSKTGVFSTTAGVEGDKYLNFYAVAWKGKTATLYVRVDGTQVGSFELAANAGASGTPPFVNLAPATTDHYSVKLTGLTASSTIEFSTTANFTVEANDASGRAILFGVKLTDEALAPEQGGNENPGGGEEPDPTPTPGGVVKATVKEFLAAAEDATIYELTGEITGTYNTLYGNFYLKDSTGEVLIYGLLTPDGQAKTQYEAAGLKDGDIITLQTVRSSHNGTPQGKDAIYVSHEAGQGGGGDDPVTPPVAGEGEYVSDSNFVSDGDQYANPCGLGDVTINGSAVTGFKIGTGSKTGVFSTTAGVEGDKALSFYAVAWKGKSATLYVRVDGTQVAAIELNPNDGASNTPPFVNLAPSASDYYSVDLTGLTASSKIEFSTSANFTVESNSTSGRAIVFGAKLN